MTHSDVLIVGAGIFGMTAALELQARGHSVTVIDPGPIPHPLAATTDISKVVRMEYGADALYMEMVEDALPGWRAWNEELGERLYHETGVTMMTRQPMQAGGFEYESYQLLLERGHDDVERLDADELVRRYPIWKAGAYVDGFFHSEGGYAESGRVVTALARLARERGVTVIEGQTAHALTRVGGAVSALTTREGERFSAGHIVIAAGAWTPVLLPELADTMTATGHPVFHLAPGEPDIVRSPAFTVFTADVSRTGWYGFPYNPREGVVKIANHGVGVALHPERDERIVTDEERKALRKMLQSTFPALAEAPLVYTRRCLYCDTRDGDLWIDRHPDLDNLIVAAGGSGHGFKLAPVLGGVIADAVERAENAWLDRFRWRSFPEDYVASEAARYQGD